MQGRRGWRKEEEDTWIRVDKKRGTIIFRAA